MPAPNLLPTTVRSLQRAIQQIGGGQADNETIAFSQGGVYSVILEPGGGLVATPDGIGITAGLIVTYTGGNGINITGGTVSAVVVSGHALTLSSSGIGLNVDNVSIAVNGSNQLEVDPAWIGAGLVVSGTPSTLQVDPTYPITTTGGGVGINLLSPFYVSTTSLALRTQAPLSVNTGGSLGLLAAIGSHLGLSLNSAGSLTVPLISTDGITIAQSGTSGSGGGVTNVFSLSFGDPFYVDSTGLEINVDDSLEIYGSGSGTLGVFVQNGSALAFNSGGLYVNVDGVTTNVNGSNQLVATASGGVFTYPTSGITYRGINNTTGTAGLGLVSGTPLDFYGGNLEVLYDRVTITTNGSNQLVAGMGGGSSTGASFSLSPVSATNCTVKVTVFFTFTTSTSGTITLSVSVGSGINASVASTYSGATAGVSVNGTGILHGQMYGGGNWILTMFLGYTTATGLSLGSGFSVNSGSSSANGSSSALVSASVTGTIGAIVASFVSG